MRFGNATRVMVVLAGAAAVAFAQTPGTTASAPVLNQRPGLPGRRAPIGNRNPELGGTAAVRQKVEDMDKTLSQMHGVLKLMRANAAKDKATDAVAKANLGMWELMVGHLDKELEELRATLAAREDLDARRAALYKQADAKAEAEAQAARAAQAARFSQAAQNASGTQTPAVAGQSAERAPAAQTVPAQPSAPPAAAQPSAAPTTNNSPSPN